MAVPAAQILLVGFGCATAVGAGLVTLTRVSVKVRLAWSTCAQTGFMLVECGLCLFGLALVHLIAHSHYKAHAFLACGETVRKTRVVQMAQSPRRVGPLATGLAAAVGISATFAFSLFWNAFPVPMQSHKGFLVISGLAPTPLVLGAFESSFKKALVSLAQAVAIAAATSLLHIQTMRFFPNQTQHEQLHEGLLAFVVASFLSLFFLQYHLKALPNGGLSRVLYPSFKICAPFQRMLRIKKKKPNLFGFASAR